MPYINFFVGLFASASIAAPSTPIATPMSSPTAPRAEASIVQVAQIPEVPFYSQFKDIRAAKWQKLGCGIAGLAMLIDFYQPERISVDDLLNEGIAAGAFINGAGWSHRGLVLLANTHGLKGANYDLSHLDAEEAFAQFAKFVEEGPVMASVRYKFEPTNPIPHLVVINGIDHDTIYYNDPAETSGGKTISIPNFIKSWKKRFIVIRP